MSRVFPRFITQFNRPVEFPSRELLKLRGLLDGTHLALPNGLHGREVPKLLTINARAGK